MMNVANDFRNCLVAELRARLQQEPDLEKFIPALETLDCTLARDLPAVAHIPTVNEYLDQALISMRVDPALAAAVTALARAIGWYEIFEGDGIEPELAKGLVAGLMAGKVGIVPSPNHPNRFVPPCAQYPLPAPPAFSARVLFRCIGHAETSTRNDWNTLFRRSRANICDAQ